MADTLLNPQQQEAVQHGTGPLLIIAGAGTGKTTVLTERIKHLILEKHVDPKSILALTFTEKAATEMEERIDIAMPYGYTQLWIETFHAFCDRILKLEGLHIGIDSGYRLISESEAILFLRKNLFAFNLEYFRPLGNPTKFLQGLLQHISRLKDEDITPEEYLQWAQTQEARFKNQGVTRVERTEGSSPARQAWQDPHRAPAANAKPSDGTDERSEGARLQNTVKTSVARNERQDPDETELEIKKNLELANAYKTYEDLKLKEGLMDFGDLITYTLKLFRERKNVLAEYQKQFEYIVIDEFQDTNYAQNQLAILLAGSAKQNITVVGDDDQAIYRWRGAAISNMIQFKKHFPTTKIITLTKNYRSTQTILDTAYKVIQNNNPDRLEIKENIDKKLESVKKITGNPVQTFLKNRVEDEADAVVLEIEKLMEKSKSKDKSYEYKDFAILVRANDHSQPFVRALERKKIPYQFLGPGQIFQQEEIKDLISYLKVLTNYEDSASMYRVLCIPIFAIDATAIATLLNTAKRRNAPLFHLFSQLDSLIIPDEEKEKIKKLSLLLRKHLSLVPKESAGQILFDFLQESGMFTQMLEATNPLDEKKAQNIAKFFEKLKLFENEHDNSSLFSAVEWIDLSMQMGESPLASSIDWDQQNGVNILTVHSSKGLEFPVVFLVNLVKDRFPSRERREQIPIPKDIIKEILPEGDYHLEEERRLFYVGVTRAKEKLFFTAAKFYGEGKRERKLSPFIAESLGIDFLEKINLINDNKIQQLSLLELFQSANSESTTPGAMIAPQKIIPVTYLSYSQIQTFDVCPLHYKLRYILKIPTPATPATSFGTSIHAALREFYQRKITQIPVEFSDIPDIVKKTWIPDGYESADHEKLALKKAIAVVTDFLKTDYIDGKKPLSLELPFEFFVDKMRVGGRIDRIDRPNEHTIEIIDYKTGSNVPEEKELKNNLQLTIYAMAAANIKDDVFKNIKNVNLSLYYLEEGKKLTTTRTTEQLEEAKKTLLEKANEITQSNFACSGSIFCKNCEYKMLCRAN